MTSIRGQQMETDPGRSLYDRLKAIERAIDELRAGRRAEATAIGAGGLVVKDGGGIVILDLDGNEVIRLGTVPSDSGYVPGMLANRPPEDGGSRALSVYKGMPTIWDRSGNVVFAADEVSGQGIARPWLPVTWAGSDFTQWPGTTSATFTPLCETALIRQQRRIFVRLRHTADASGTTGELRVMCNGVQLGATAAVSFAINYTDVGPIALPDGDFGEALGLTVDGRRTAGTGQVRATVTASWTAES